MAIQNEKFGFTVRDNTTGTPLTGALVELRKGATIYTLTEVSTSGFYTIASIPTGKYSVFVDSVDTGQTMPVGSGQVAALGNELDNIPVSNATEYDFQDPTEYKTTLSLENVTNVAVPAPIVADANKVISVDSSGNYELRTISTSGFDTVFEVTTTAGLREALEAEYDAKLIIINREDFNFTNTQSFDVWGSCSILLGNTFEPFQWLSNSVNASFNYKAGADVALTGMMFLNGVVAFGSPADYTLNIPWKVTNLDFIGSDSFRSVNGTGTLVYENAISAIPASVTVATSQDWWQNSASDKLDSVVAGTNITIDNTDPQNPIINSSGGAQTIEQVLQTGKNAETDIQFDSAAPSGSHLYFSLNSNDNNSNLLAKYEEDTDLFRFRGSGSTIRDLAFTRADILEILRLKFSDANGGADLAGRLNFLASSNPSPSQGDLWNESDVLKAEGPFRANGVVGAGGASTETSMDKWVGQTRYDPFATEKLFFVGDTLGIAGTIGNNSYFDGSNWKSIQAGNVVHLGISNATGNFVVYEATATAADQILSFTQLFNVNSDSTSVKNVFNLGSTTNSTPSTGDVWNNGSQVEIEANTKTNGIVDVGTDETSPQLRIGKNTFLTTAGAGISHLISGGSIFNDYKTNTAGTIFFRCGENTEAGSAHTFMEVDPTDGYIKMPSLPTSSAGLAAGTLWNDAGTLKIA